MTCPLCGTSLAALSDKRFGVCSKDGLVVNGAYEFRRYEHDYFEQEYRNQYGRSYTEDRQAILARNEIRFAKLKELAPVATHPQVLEVGSAAGYFLKIMQEAGYAVRGWEISEAMTKYSNARGIKTVRQDFLRGAALHEKQQKQPYDIVAMFYVLEHIPEQKLAWQKLAGLVRPGGYLLLALPSAGGPTFHFHRQRWYDTHPLDHSVDYSPRSLKLAGRQFGFKLVSAFSEGIHPQRFPLGAYRLPGRLYRAALEHAPLGDTIFAILLREQ
ncbi:MAG TPA: class I SAM-dependent methyltransferase [Turneriella sp.]|nr:class I SAM-dependent methyltransferase [Turneriella sp.]HNA78989.1 class I SAM-dependent methyltransferase [Turneriella sp.]HNE19111.1 class I SAM-dependent methyltransferase [Turneriella sp.]HNJ65169.1 class I SAM-dependent methyltransferase [Turneriella sp.]HNL11888.1 class I SAM-dependent methyltransferase [Turneriella sp.]